MIDVAHPDCTRNPPRRRSRQGKAAGAARWHRRPVCAILNQQAIAGDEIRPGSLSRPCFIPGRWLNNGGRVSHCVGRVPRFTGIGQVDDSRWGRRASRRNRSFRRTNMIGAGEPGCPLQPPERFQRDWKRSGPSSPWPFVPLALRPPGPSSPWPFVP
jgi:hypothetical protein